MKTTPYIFILFFLFSTVYVLGQNYVDLVPGETKIIKGIAVNCEGVVKKTKKGEDLYRITITLDNKDNNFIRLFTTAWKVFLKNDKSAIAKIRFLNATGRGLSATSGKLYGQPVNIKVPYSCKKCPAPTDKKTDPYHHYIKNYIIGIQFIKGSTLAKTYSIRVPQKKVPKVRVMLD